MVRPLARIPQVCSEPALIALALAIRLTAIGIGRVTRVPSPSWPYLFAPQQTARPVARIAQVCKPPTLIDRASPRLATGVGINRSKSVPSPIW